MGSNTQIANHINDSSEEFHHMNVLNHEAIAKNVPEDILREINAYGLLGKLQELKFDALKHVNEIINNLVSEVLRRTEMSPNKNKKLKNDKYRDKEHCSKEGMLPDKLFLERNSLLTDLFQINHIRTVYNMFMVTLILLFFNTVAYDIMDTGTLFIGTYTLQKGFAKFSVCIYIWSLMLITTLGVYLAFNIWARQRLELSPRSFVLKIWDYSWLITLISYQVLFVVCPTKAMIDEGFHIGCSAIVLMEQVRMIMKSYAFIRTIAPRFLQYKPHTEIPKPSVPKFSQYLYFLFVPTLIYRDTYPRTQKIRWKVVIQNFIEVGLVIFYHAFIAERFIAPVFQNYGKQPLDWRWYVKSILGTMIPGILLFISGFYLLLHAWHNAWAELLRFADRLFYKDWWNCTSYRTYYRTWNVIIHDWLYTYVYKDMYENLVPRNKMFATYTVFLTSAIVHEYIVAFTFRFFYPVMLVLFGGIGFGMIFINRASSNIFLWTSLCIGNGVMVSLYAIEYYARQNCLPYDNNILDLFLPRSWSCKIE